MNARAAVTVREVTRRLVGVLCILMLVPGDVLASVQSTQAQPTRQAQPATQSTASQKTTIPPDQLDSLVAPIALYPDPLLAQTLAASTYPLEIIELQQWLQKNPGLKDKALADAVAKQDWDPSVQALAPMPDLVKRLADDLQWTTDLGNAFLAQQSDVMAAVQRMRAKAKDKGNLKTTEQQKVDTQVVEGKQTIVIQPASTEVVYVPSYNPTVVYGAPVYPYPPIYYPPPGYYAAGMAISFGIGVAMGAFWGGGWGWGCGWGGNNVYINNNNNFINNRNNINNINRPSQLPNRGGAGGVGGVGGVGGAGRPGGVGGAGGVGGVGGVGGAGRPGGVGGAGGVGGVGGAGGVGGVGGPGGVGGAGGRGPSQLPAGDSAWQHNPSHRGGAPYSDRATADRFGGAARGDSLANRQGAARQQISREGGNLPSNRGGGGGLGDRGGGNGLGAGNRGGAGGIGGGNRGGAGGVGGGGDRVGNRSVSSGGGSRSAFGGGSSGFSGSSARASSARGSSSFGGGRGGGGFSGGGRGGGGGRRR